MEEVWKDIEGYEGLYQVSNLGKVKSIDRYIKQYNGYNYSIRIYRGKILKSNIGNRGYLKVVLHKQRKAKTYNVHRLVAETFILNPNNYSQVNHKDENKLNNCVDNLEWCTSKYNINFGQRNTKVANKLKGVHKSEIHKKNLSIARKKYLLENKIAKDDNKEVK
jgi:hypothetical protein